MPSAPIISFDYRPPPALTRLVLAALGAALLAPWLSGAPPELCLLLDLGLLGRLLQLLRRPPAPLRRMAWLGDRRWLLDVGQPQERIGQLDRVWCWGRWLVLVLAVPGRGREGLWLLPGQLPAATLRRLHQRVRLDRHPIPSPPDSG